jgi:hypothetical protein
MRLRFGGCVAIVVLSLLPVLSSGDAATGATAATTPVVLETAEALRAFAARRGCGGLDGGGLVCLYGAFASPDDDPYAHAFAAVAAMLRSSGTSDIVLAVATGKGAAELAEAAAGLAEVADPAAVGSAAAAPPPTLFAHLPFQHGSGLAAAAARPQWRRSAPGTLPDLGAKARLKRRMRHILDFVYAEALEPILYYPRQPRARLALRLSSYPKLAVPFGKAAALSTEVRTKLAAVGHAYRSRLHVVAVDLNEPSGQGDTIRKELNLRIQKSGFKVLFWDPVAPGLPKHYSLSNGLALSSIRSWLGNPLSEHPAVPHRLPGFSKKRKKKKKKKKTTTNSSKKRKSARDKKPEL